MISAICVVVGVTIAWTQLKETQKERSKAEIALNYAQNAITKAEGLTKDVSVALSQADATEKSIRDVANTILKISYIVADGSGRFGGIPQEHLNKRISRVDRRVFG